MKNFGLKKSNFFTFRHTINWFFCHKGVGNSFTGSGLNYV